MSRSAWVRAQAARVLNAVVSEGRSLDAALQIRGELSAQERGLLGALSYDSVRWYLRLNAVLRLLVRSPHDLAPEVHALAVVGLCQLLHTDIPAHAAVDETVNAVRMLGQPRASGLLNAVMRRCIRERESLLADVDRDPAVATAHPRWLYEALGVDWAARAPSIIAANNAHPPFWLRVNVRQISGSAYRKRLESAGLRVSRSLFEDEALCLSEAVDVHALPGFAEGLVSVQDAAAQLAARLLNARANDRVLDACAAPGGKTAHILERQAELAEVVAVDVSAERMQRVRDNLQRAGLAASLITADVGALDQWWDGRPFERVLLDVPCSATGVIRRHPDIKLLRRADDIQALADKQLRLLESVWQVVADGGRLLYASCSALRAETTDVVERFVRSAADATDETLSASRALGLPFDVESGMRIAAGTADMDGFYYACLQKGRG